MRRRVQNFKDTAKSFTKLNGRIPMAALVQTLAVAEYLSFRHAAKALGISQSSVSFRIRTLEDELGVLLFERNTRGVRLTEAGRRFIAQVDDAIEILDTAIKAVASRTSGPQDNLHIGVHALLPGGFLDRLLERFHREHSLVDLHISEGTARDAQIMVRERKLDLAFMACTYELPDLHSRVIWHDRLIAALPATHPLAAEASVTWAQLAGEIFLVREGGTGPQVHDLIVTRSAGRWPVPEIRRPDVGCGSLLSMIAAGYGVSLFVKEKAATATPNVVFLPISDEPETIAFSAVWSPSNRSPALKNFLTLATDLGSSQY